MDSDYRDLLLNVIIVLLPLLFYQYLYRWMDSGRRHAAAVFFAFVGPMLFTMTFPVHILDSAVDLRSVPLILGSLYGGPIATIFLFAAMFWYRDVVGGLNMANFFLSLLPAIVLIFAAHRRFDRFRFRQRVWTAVGICFALRIGSVLIYYGLQSGYTDALFDAFEKQFPLIIGQCALIGLHVYLLEAIRKHHRMNEEILHAEKMKVVSELAAAVAHEVRNPLTTVRGFVQLLGGGRLDDAKRASYSAICLEELDRAQLIISNFLALGKPEAEKKERLNVKDELRYVANLLSSYANFRNVSVRNRVDVDAAVYGDRSKFRQAVINLGKNAIEATQGGGTVEFHSAVEGRELVLYVTDTGGGMSAEKIARLGTPYYSTKEKGTGLGTLATFHIVRQMGGRIVVTSRIGEGTTCKISLPLYEGGP